jgi:hypothetical protein
MPSIILSDNGVSSGSAGIKTTGANDGTLVLQTTTSGGTPTTAVTLDNSQNATFAGTMTAPNATFAGTMTAPTAAITGSLNAPNTFGFKNRIINGAMQIAQRATSSSAGTYSCLDRWYFNFNGTAPTASQQTSTVNGIPCNVMQIAGASGNTGQNVLQRIEAKNCYDLVGQSVTVSFWAYQTTGSAFSLQTGLNYANAADNFSTTTNISTNTTSIPNTTWTYVSFTVSSLPSGAANGLQLGLFANGAALTSGVFQFAFVQLEKGSLATSFDYRPYGTELALCERYYETGFYVWRGYTAAGAVNYGVIQQFSVTKRVTPTIATNSFTGTGFSSANISSVYPNGFDVYSTGSVAQGSSYSLVWTASSEL